MGLSLRYWEQTTGKTKVDMAEESKIWTVSMDKSGPRTRTLDKYLKVSKLPDNIRSRNVLNTGYFVLKNCPPDDPEMKKLLEAKINQLEAMLRKFD